ncbi:MAG: phosphate ABC transporter permease PstA [Chloroflexi bacterium]|nr:phosphate ABC transporter permease PstA [Chloroflexota bacterium]MCI0890836.1 phosphate ABC transporter permease PstA [Chloroflexota bacterium]
MAVIPVRLRATGRVARRQAVSRASRWLLLAASLAGVAIFAYLAYDTIASGASRLTWDFLTSYPSRFADRAGLRSSILGSAWILGATIVLSFPVAIGTAIWIEEFAPKHPAVTIVKLNLANLAGVPSIIYGILGLAMFVRFAGLGPVILAGALTLAVMIVPMTVIAAQEAIRQVPQSLRDGSLALGATHWQTVRHHVLPAAAPGIITGVILAISRAAGETAALIMLGAFTFIAWDNTSLFDDFTTVPIQIYNWTVRPSQQGFQMNASAAIMVLMVAVLAMNFLAAMIRERFRRD